MTKLVKSHKIKGMEIKPPKKPTFSIPTDENFFPLHCLSLFSGRRGGGKSVAVANLIRIAKQKNYFDKVWLITPTYWSNKEIWDICDIQPPCDDAEENEIFEPTRDVLRKIDRLLNLERKKWEEYLVLKKRWEDYQHALKHDLTLSPDELLDYYEMGFMDGGGKPEWDYPHEGPARCAVVIDDAVGSELYQKPSSGLLQFCISHRHRAKGVGISVFMLVQTYACQSGGVPRPIRENCTHLCLFKLKDENQLEKIHKEIGSDIDLGKFDAIFKHATKDPYCFLTIDFNAKPNRTFRKCFNEVLN